MATPVTVSIQARPCGQAIEAALATASLSFTASGTDRWASPGSNGSQERTITITISWP